MDESSSSQSFFEVLGKSYWHHLFLGAVFLTSIFLLLLRDVSSEVIERFVPALVVYTLGTGVIGHAQGVEYRRNFGPSHYKEPRWAFTAVHALWVLALIGYLLARGVI